ncbi:MAG: amidohydrolase [Actinobacteria bacterium]|nr:amidohydrolase [Actinomycetota bacterium]
MSDRLVIDDIDYLITCDSQNRVLRDSAIAIEAGKIVEIGRSGTVTGTERVSARGRIITPGLINTHTHLAMTLLRGWAEGVDLDGFLKKVWAAEGAIMDEATCKLGTELGAVEAILSGTTTTLDMYLHPHATHQGAVRVGLRHIAGPIFFDFPGLDSLEWSDRIAFARSWPKRLAEIGGPWIPTYLMPHSTYTDSPEHLREVSDLARELGAAIHLHISETIAENLDVQGRYQKSPVEVLEFAGILDRHTIYGHGVHLSESDIETTAKYNGAVAHCPGSNMKLGSGLADIGAYIDAGVNVGLGTDGCSSSNDLDMWQTMRMAAHLISIKRSPAHVDASSIFRLATIDGAKALGISDQVGSVETGKFADFIAIDLAKPHLTPIHDIFALLVFAVGRGDVTDVWVDGEQVVRDAKPTKVDAVEIMTQANKRVRSLDLLKESF